MSTTSIPPGSSIPKIDTRKIDTPKIDTPKVDTDERRLMIREQLDRLLESHLFRNSKRYPTMLRHIVEQTLAGRTEEIKERSLGVDVFNRSPDYDCSADPIVRVSAAEIRKRLAQYYDESKHREQLRIELPLGSYIPTFHWLEGNLAALETVEAPAPVRTEPELLAMQRPLPVKRWMRSRVVALIAGATALVAIAAVTFLVWPKSALDLFWRPVLADPQPILLCVSKDPGPPDQVTAAGQDSGKSGIAWADVVSLTSLVSMVRGNKHPFQLLREDRASFAELQQSAAILIGAFNDTWTMRLSDVGRYGFARDGTTYWIVDRQKNGARQWGVSLDKRNSLGKLDLHEDFALISRVQDHTTGKMLVTVGGLWGYGTQAATKFLTDPQYLAKAAAGLNKGWQSKNLQLVIRTEVIDGVAGPPALIASSVW